MFPEDPSKYHPVQLINQMKPGTEFIATRCLNFPSFFQVSCVIDGVLFTGQRNIFITLYLLLGTVLRVEFIFKISF